MNAAKKISKYFVLIFFALLILFPVYMVLTGSFKTEFELYDNVFGLPEKLQWSNYIRAFVDGNLKQYYVNSIVVTGCSIVCIMGLASMAAFAMTRLRLRLSRIIYMLFVIGIAVPTQVGIVQLAVQMSKMHLTNSLFGLICVYVAYELPFSVFIFYGFMQDIPWELQEAAVIDGCGSLRLYWSVLLPLCKSAVATVAIFNLVAIWNDMLFPLVLISKESLRTLPYGLLQFRGQYASEYTVIFAGVILITLPLVILYLCMQKQFMQGLTQGAVKG